MSEFPKFVIPDPSHVVRSDGGHVSTPGFPEFFVNRVTQEVTVLVHDETQEAIALAPYVAPGHKDISDSAE